MAATVDKMNKKAHNIMLNVMKKRALDKAKNINVSHGFVSENSDDDFEPSQELPLSGQRKKIIPPEKMVCNESADLKVRKRTHDVSVGIKYGVAKKPKLNLGKKNLISLNDANGHSVVSETISSSSQALEVAKDNTGNTGAINAKDDNTHSRMSASLSSLGDDELLTLENFDRSFDDSEQIEVFRRPSEPIDKNDLIKTLESNLTPIAPDNQITHISAPLTPIIIAANRSGVVLPSENNGDSFHNVNTDDLVHLSVSETPLFDTDNNPDALEDPAPPNIDDDVLDLDVEDEDWFDTSEETFNNNVSNKRRLSKVFDRVQKTDSTKITSPVLKDTGTKTTRAEVSGTIAGGTKVSDTRASDTRVIDKKGSVTKNTETPEPENPSKSINTIFNNNSRASKTGTHKLPSNTADPIKRRTVHVNSIPAPVASTMSMNKRFEVIIPNTLPPHAITSNASFSAQIAQMRSTNIAPLRPTSKVQITQNIPSLLDYNRNSQPPLLATQNIPSLLDYNRNIPPPLHATQNIPSLLDYNRNIPPPLLATPNINSNQADLCIPLPNTPAGLKLPDFAKNLADNQTPMAFCFGDACRKFLGGYCTLNANQCSFAHYLPDNETFAAQLKQLGKEKVKVFYEAIMLRMQKLMSRYLPEFCKYFGENKMEHCLARMADDCADPHRRMLNLYPDILRGYMKMGLSYDYALKKLINSIHNPRNTTCNQMVNMILDKRVNNIQLFVDDLCIIAKKEQYEMSKHAIDTLCDMFNQNPSEDLVPIIELIDGQIRNQLKTGRDNNSQSNLD